MIVVTGSFIAQEGRLEEALALSLKHVRRSRGEEGCLSHAVHQDVENQSRLVFVEEWQSSEALAAHFALPATRAFAKALAELAEGPASLSVFEATRIRG